jgi:acyl-CoA reductase-like NAD-dependent aldehyde dehydrogenase
MTETLVQHPDRLFIGGDWVRPSSDATFDVVQPATEEVFLRVAAAQAADADAAAAAARAAFDRGPWPRLSHAERAEHLRALADGLDRRAADLAVIATSEMGIVHVIAGFLMAELGQVYRDHADLAADYPWVERHRPTAGGEVGLLVREPVGVVTAIVPWNSPAHLAAYKVAPALLAGCTVILKASPEAPGAAYVLAEVAEEAGLPAGVLNVVTADREVSELLVRDPRVDKVSFTGSTAAGRRIGAICADRVARCTLELGGKSAAVILDDADIAATCAGIAGAATFMTGQVCSSLTRIIVGRDRHDDVVDALAGALAAVTVGDPFEVTTQMGPLAMQRQLERVQRYVAVGREEGAKLATGGGRPAGLDRGWFIEPTVFAGVDNGSTIAREEIFGPVLSVIPADDDEHAVELANDTIYGLNASVFTADTDRALDVARRLRSGTVGHNAFRTDFGIAFGGCKQSGIGREGGREGLLPYLEPKTVILDGEPA